MKSQLLAFGLRRPLIALALLALPTAATPQTTSIKFAAVGDIGNTVGSAAVAKLIRSQSPQFVTLLGDLCYDDQPIAEQINANYSSEKTAGRLYPALGNHEFTDPCGGGPTAAGYLRYFTLPNNERYYDFVKAGSIYVTLASRLLSPPAIQLRTSPILHLHALALRALGRGCRVERPRP
jgi:hypothetical protein